MFNEKIQAYKGELMKFCIQRKIGSWYKHTVHCRVEKGAWDENITTPPEGKGKERMKGKPTKT